MLSGIKEKVNGDLTIPLRLNILVYSCTYLLSIIFCLVSCSDSSSLFELEFHSLLKALADSLVPTTATLVLSNTIQNMVLISQAQVKKFALSVWSLIAVVAYTMLYASYRNAENGYFHCLIVIFSAGIVILELYAIAQVEEETRMSKVNVSISG